MLTDTHCRRSAAVQNFPVQQLSVILQKTESELLNYYQSWKNSRKPNRLEFDQSFIAGLVGQSKTTVSNFINRRFQNISAPKQEVLRQVIDLLGYKPSQSAQLIRAKEKRWSASSPTSRKRLPSIILAVFWKGLNCKPKNINTAFCFMTSRKRNRAVLFRTCHFGGW